MPDVTTAASHSVLVSSVTKPTQLSEGRGCPNQGQASLKYPPNDLQTIDFLAAHRHQLFATRPASARRQVAKGGHFYLGADIFMWLLHFQMRFGEGKTAFEALRLRQRVNAVDVQHGAM